MQETYTRKQAMDRLGVKTVSSFLRMESRYPEAFVIVKRNGDKDRQYDKTTLDRFAAMREYFRQEKR